MGEKLRSYTDDYGNTVIDGSTVVFSGREYFIKYISNLYVNMEDTKTKEWKHHPFDLGVPSLKTFGGWRSPVQTQVVKKLVSGQYGVVKVVARPSTGNPLVKMSCTPTVKELRDAARTLEEVAEFLESCHE